MKEHDAIMVQLLFVIAESLNKDSKSERFLAAKANYQKVMTPALKKYGLTVPKKDAK